VDSPLRFISFFLLLRSASRVFGERFNDVFAKLRNKRKERLFREIFCLFCIRFGNSTIRYILRYSSKMEKLRLTSCHTTRVFDEMVDICFKKQRNMRKLPPFHTTFSFLSHPCFSWNKRRKRFEKWRKSETVKRFALQRNILQLTYYTKVKLHEISSTSICLLYGPLSPPWPSVLSTVLCPLYGPLSPSRPLCPLYGPPPLYGPLPLLRPSVLSIASVSSTALCLLYGPCPLDDKCFSICFTKWWYCFAALQNTFRRNRLYYMFGTTMMGSRN
jgi:hypothetical protein